jgi:carbonic anhydrase
MSAAQAFAVLREGNERFVRNIRSIESLATQAHRHSLVSGQCPKAIILSCSDSRVPAEIVFDCGLGDLFVVRVAGNVCAPSLVGSVEFAAATFGTELVIVMGHSKCGAVDVTLAELKKGRNAAMSSNIADIVERIRPAVYPLLEVDHEPTDLLRAAVRANVQHSVDHLRHASRVLEERIADGKLVVVGAEYELETGVVDFFDVPSAFKHRATSTRRLDAPESHREAAPLSS